MCIVEKRSGGENNSRLEASEQVQPEAEVRQHEAKEAVRSGSQGEARGDVGLMNTFYKDYVQTADWLHPN